MRRHLLLGAGAILLAGVALGAAVWILTQPGPLQIGGPGPPDPQAVGNAPAPLPGPGAGPPGRPLPPAPSKPGPIVGRPPRPPGELFTGLGPLGEIVSQCVARAAPPAPAGAGPAVLVLDLQPLDGRVRILDASPLQGSSAPEALAGCARSELVGREVLLGGTRPGKPYKMSLSIRR